jgi:hypothetical protein
MLHIFGIDQKSFQVLHQLNIHRCPKIHIPKANKMEKNEGLQYYLPIHQKKEYICSHPQKHIGIKENI